MKPRQCGAKHGIGKVSRCTLNAGHRSVHFEDDVSTESYRFWVRRGQRSVKGWGSPFGSRFVSGAGRTATAHVWILRLVIAARLARVSRYRPAGEAHKPKESP